VPPLETFAAWLCFWRLATFFFFSASIKGSIGWSGLAPRLYPRPVAPYVIITFCRALMSSITWASIMRVLFSMANSYDFFKSARSASNFALTALVSLTRESSIFTFKAFVSSLIKISRH
jgi:hypothetical protein